MASHDPTRVAAGLTRIPTLHRRIADRVYVARRVRDLLNERDGQAVIPPNPKRKRPNSCDKRADRGRNAVERKFCRRNDFRPIARCYDKRADAFLSAVCLVTPIVWWVQSRVLPETL